jgi:hypothetical protein
MIRPAVGGLALAIALAASSHGQAPAAKAKAPDYSPLGRYVPAEGLLLYEEFDGTEAHADAWKGTAAYKILNDTSTGAMLEEVAAQLIDQSHTPGKLAFPGIPGLPATAPPADSPGGSASPGASPVLSGPEIVAIAKHVGQFGAVLAQTLPGEKGGPPVVVVVIRAGALTKPSIALFGKLIRSMAGPSAAMAAEAKPGGRKVVVVTDASNKSKNWAWWTEKNGDLVLALAGAASADPIIAAIDGKVPNATTNTRLVELSKPEDSFQPVGRAWFDLDRMSNVLRSANVAGQAINLQDYLPGVKEIDYRFGFDGGALVSVTRVAAPSPRSAMLKLLDQPTFSAKDLPPIPEGVDNFTVLSVDSKALFDTMVTTLKSSSPAVSEKIDEFAKTLQSKHRVKLRDDLVGRIGPKLALYVSPNKKATGLASALTSLTGQMPKFTLLADTPDATAFSKALDAVMIQLNKELKAAFPPTAPAAGADAGQADGSGGRGRRSGPSAPEFKMSPGLQKTYILSLPPQYAAFVNIQLTISVGKNHVAIASSPTGAREALALEGKNQGRWKADGETASAFEKLSKDLCLLQVDDPKDELAQSLATLPTVIQKMFTPLSSPAPAPAVAQGAPGAGGAQEGMMAMMGGRGRGRPGSSSGFSGAGPAGGGTSSGGADVPSTPNAGGYRPGMSSGGASGPPGGSSGAPGGSSGAPGGSSSGGPGGAADAGALIKVDSSKLPSADSIKRLLFPGTMAVSVDGQGAKITTREAFPNLARVVSAFGGIQLFSAFSSGRLNPAALASPGGNPPPGQRGQSEGTRGPEAASAK